MRRRVRVERLAVEGEDLLLVGAEAAEGGRVPAASVRRVGLEKRYSRVLTALTIAVAIVSLYTQELLHTILVLLVLGITLATREEVLVLEMVDGGIVEIAARDRRSVRRAAEELGRLLTR